MKSRCIFFVDGFNLYHAIAAPKHLQKYKWLDLWSLCQRFLSTREELKAVVFFTALYPGNEKRIAKHTHYIRALENTGVEIIFGNFKKKDKFCQKCRQSTPGYEEKETDVNIAIEMLKRAVKDEYDTAFLISADSDLTPALKTIKELYPQKIIRVLWPPNRRADNLRSHAHLTIKMKEKHLATNQLPNPLIINNLTFHKPDDWK